MFENILKFFKKGNKKESSNSNSKDAAKERLHLVLMQDRANVSADFLDLMRQEIIEVIKKYIDIDESTMDVKLTNQTKEDGTQGAPVLYANIPIVNIKDETKKLGKKEEPKKETSKKEEKKDNETEKDITEKENKAKGNETKEENEEKQENNNDEDKRIEEEKIEEAKKIVEEETKTDTKKSEDDENK